ncbi:MAG: protease modulator HflC [Verrucomicrobia bacterium]|jgi:membrane protease subunit HflC|nr:protease modulator HflC [Verrucomicrobiota bacterium]MBT3914441.1 protease modulator HflC [Verrucomicrobiota bacterium]MBT4227119.1 protease modulator HflC [Verrucomicrobiota bacterium]MBT4901108.1 protease modulator HflC [Verrucomicrobiota bacterium]MBT6104921.1 protease modulator HflC [Verrucomicrobiota bacterium]
MLKQFTSTFIGIGIFIAAITFFSAVYIVDETKQVFVTQFGDIISGPHNGPGKDEAGLYFRIPFITKVHEFEKRYLEWDGDPNEVTTKDKRFIYIDTYARWRIVDAEMFYKNLQDENSAKLRLNDILDGAARNVVAANDLKEVIRSHQRESIVADDQVLDGESQLVTFEQGRSKLAQLVMEDANKNVPQFGIKLLDFRFKRINYHEDVQKTIFERMISERSRISSRFRSEGAGEAAKILGTQQRELKEITSKAYLEKQQIMGEADAKAVAIYAEAFDQSTEAREFYEFLKTMETLETTLSKEDTLIFSTDSDFFRYLKRSAPTKE